MGRRLFANLATVLGALGLILPSGALAQDVEDARIARIERFMPPAVMVEGREYPAQTLTELMQAKAVPGVSIAVIDGGRLVWAKAYGLADAASGQAVTTNTRFQAASISKAVTATAALDLVEQDVLALDADVNAALTSWKVPAGEAGRPPVTLRGLLTHTAGLTVHGFPGYAEGAPLPTVVQVLNGEAPANTAAVVVDQAPGSARRYSGGGFTVAQLQMSDATGEAFPDLMRARLLTPAGMANSTFEQPLPQALRSVAATAHDAEGRPVVGRFHAYPEMAAAGLWTTPSDLARWVMAIDDAWAGRSDRLLDQKTARAMLTPGLGGWGLGVGLEGESNGLSFYHFGGNEGFMAVAIGYPALGKGLVVMTNGQNGRAVIDGLTRAVAAEYGWPDRKTAAVRSVAVEPDELRDAAGRYEFSGFQLTFSVMPDGKGLTVTTGDGHSSELIPQGDDVYIDVSGNERLRFERDNKGQVVALIAPDSRFLKLE